MAIRLYQFAISHYCEKVRWALAFKGINHEAVNLLPGQHVKALHRLGADTSSVPAIDHDGRCVQGSAAIIDYLEETFPEHPLTPEDPELRRAATDWERRLDEELGPAVRCYSYHHFLQRPKVVTPLLTAGTPFYNRFIVRLAFSRVDEIMRKWMKINEKTANSSREVVERYLIELAAVYEARSYLVGDTFTRADLAAAALFAPLFQPPQYPVPWPKPARMPKLIQAWLDQWQSQLKTLETLYAANR